jgi:lysyl-tRNA synthetase class 2
MVEWYRVNGTYTDGVEETLNLIEAAGKALRKDFKLGTPTFLTVEEAFQEFAGVNPFNEESLKEKTGETNYQTAFFKLLVEKVEPAISKFTGPVILHLYPEAFSALAKVVNGKAQRFELYFKGVELANGYTELTTYEEYEKVLSQKEKSYDFGLLKLLKEKPLPPCEGVALGLDRLLALLTGRKSVKEVIPFSTQKLIEEIKTSLPNP